MKPIASLTAAALASVLATSAAGAATTVTVDGGQSAQIFTLYGQGAISPGLGSFTIGQGAGSYNGGTNVSLFLLSGLITGGSAGYNSGEYVFATAYLGADSPDGGPNAPFAQSNPSNPNQFFYDFLAPSTVMTLYLFDTPTGNHVIPLVTGGNFDGPGFGFGFTSAGCTGVAVCGQNNVGLTPGATISGPVDIGVSFSVPEPATWSIMLVGFAGLGAALRSRRKALAAA